MYSYVVFRDQESVGNIPKSGYTFHIPAPVIDDRPGGLGLDDIRHLLDSTNGDTSFEFQSIASLEIKTLGRVIGGRIKRARMLFIVPFQLSLTNAGEKSYIIAKDFYTIPKLFQIVPNEGLKRRKKLTNQFLRWRGFHKLEPIEARDIKESEWFEKPDSEQVRMRAALQWCAQIAGRPNPAVICKLTTHENDGKESDSSPASASMDSSESSSPESRSPTTLDIPISQSTSKSTESSSLPTGFPHPPSQSLSELTQLPPEPTAARIAGKLEKNPGKNPKDQMLDKSPEEQLEQPQSVASFWNFFGR